MQYRAPWSRTVILVTIGVIMLLAGVGVVVQIRLLGIAIWSMIPLLAAFGVRGYSIAEGELVIHLMFHTKRLALRRLRNVRVEPNATAGSIRLFGNGGVFGFTGLFRNSSLGKYRAWVTDAELAVVLEFEHRTVVISPDRPNLFAEDLRARTGLETPPEVELEEAADV